MLFRVRAGVIFNIFMIFKNMYMAAREKEKPCATLRQSGVGWRKVPWHKVPRHKVGGTRLPPQGYFPMVVFIGVI